MTRRRATASPRGRRRQSRLRRIVSGDRVYAFVSVGVVAALAAMAIGPLQSYTAAADRVDELTETRDVLRGEVDRLEDRREQLHDLDEIELMARRHLGLVKPGEVPFVVVTPEAPPDRLHPDATVEDPERAGQAGPWYRQLSRWLGSLLP